MESNVYGGERATGRGEKVIGVSHSDLTRVNVSALVCSEREAVREEEGAGEGSAESEADTDT